MQIGQVVFISFKCMGTSIAHTYTYFPKWRARTQTRTPKAFLARKFLQNKSLISMCYQDKKKRKNIKSYIANLPVYTLCLFCMSFIMACHTVVIKRAGGVTWSALLFFVCEFVPCCCSCPHCTPNTSRLKSPGRRHKVCLSQHLKS